MEQERLTEKEIDLKDSEQYYLVSQFARTLRRKLPDVILICEMTKEKPTCWKTCGLLCLRIVRNCEQSILGPCLLALYSFIRFPKFSLTSRKAVSICHRFL